MILTLFSANFEVVKMSINVGWCRKMSDYVGKSRIMSENVGEPSEEGSMKGINRFCSCFSIFLPCLVQQLAYRSFLVVPCVFLTSLLLSVKSSAPSYFAPALLLCFKVLSAWGKNQVLQPFPCLKTLLVLPYFRWLSGLWKASHTQKESNPIVKFTYICVGPC